MKKTTFIALIIAVFAIETFGQIKSIGQRVYTFNDSTRTGGTGSGSGPGRQILTAIFYPSSAAADGDSTAIASGQYPVLIFGH